MHISTDASYYSFSIDPVHVIIALLDVELAQQRYQNHCSLLSIMVIKNSIAIYILIILKIVLLCIAKYFRETVISLLFPQVYSIYVGADACLIYY